MNWDVDVHKMMNEKRRKNHTRNVWVGGTVTVNAGWKQKRIMPCWMERSSKFLCYELENFAKEEKENWCLWNCSTLHVQQIESLMPWWEETDQLFSVKSLGRRSQSEFCYQQMFWLLLLMPDIADDCWMPAYAKSQELIYPMNDRWGRIEVGGPTRKRGADCQYEVCCPFM